MKNKRDRTIYIYIYIFTWMRRRRVVRIRRSVVCLLAWEILKSSSTHAVIREKQGAKNAEKERCACFSLHCWEFWYVMRSEGMEFNCVYLYRDWRGRDGVVWFMAFHILSKYWQCVVSCCVAGCIDKGLMFLVYFVLYVYIYIWILKGCMSECSRRCSVSYRMCGYN